MRVALDTNFLAYYSGVKRADSDQHKIDAARQTLPILRSAATIVLAAQVVGELYNVLTIRRGWSRSAVAVRVGELRGLFAIIMPSEDLLFDAVGLASEHQLQIWDAIILASAASAGCELLLSEDMHPGFAWRGCSIANPFAAAPDARLAALLA